jgi:ketosteroid isomerase-like protein
VKKTFFVLGCIFMSVTSVLSRGDQIERSKSQMDEVIRADRAWAQAAVDGDTNKMASFMSDDYVEIVLIPATAAEEAKWTMRGKAEWVEAVRSGRDKYESVHLHNLKVYLHGDVATVTGNYSQKGTSDGKDNSAVGPYVNTWARRSGRWQVVSSVFP